MSDTTNTPVNLDINDLVNAVKIIDFAFEQGAFKGVDATRGILQVRDRLANFLESLPKADDAPATDSADAPTAPVATTAAKAPPVKKIKRK